MSPLRHPRPLAWAGVLLLVGLAFEWTPLPAAAQGKLDISAKLVPADAPFYSASLRTREQFDLFIKSRAFAALKDLQSVQMALQFADIFLAQQGGPIDLWNKFSKDPENRDLIDLVVDAASHEIFCTGGQSSVDFLNLMGRLNSSRFAPLGAMLGGGNFGGQDANMLQARMMLRDLLENREKLKAPDLVIGFKIEKAERAQAQIKRLEKLLGNLAEEHAELKGRVKRTTIGGESFLTVKLDGSLVPWESIPLDLFAENAGQFEPLVKKLKSLQLTLSLGVRDGYLLLGIGEGTAAVASLGAEGKRLIDRPEFRPVHKYAGERLTAVGYASKSFRQATGGGGDLEELFGQIRDNVPPNLIPEGLRKKLEKQLKELGKKAKAAVEDIGPQTTFSFLTSNGYESFTYDWSRHHDADATKPLTILNHVGGNPLLAVAGRSKSDPESYRELVDLVKTGGALLDEWVATQPDEFKEQFTKWNKALRPLLKRLDEITGTMFLPALGEGQGALVIDAKWSSKQWHRALPDAAKPLPMVELGIVAGVSDSPLLQKAIASYGKLVEDTFVKIGELLPDQGVPQFKFPKPNTFSGPNGKLFTWALPEASGLDTQVAPTAGLGDKFAVVTLSAAHAERLLKATPLQSESTVLMKSLNKPLAGAVHCNFAGMVDAVKPWIDFGGNHVAQQFTGGDIPLDVRKQIHTVLDVLKCFRGAGSIEYPEDGAMVTHGESIFRDLPLRGKKSE